MKIMLNNTILSADSPALHTNDRGFLLGDGIFETLCAEKGILLFFDKHYERLKKSAQALQIPLPYSLEDLNEQCHRLLNINELNEVASARITLTRGRAERGIQIPKSAQPTLLITTASYTPHPDKTLTAFITSIKRNEHSAFTTLKTVNYLDSIMARQTAIQHGFEEGIMLNTQGAVTETTIGNLFIITDEGVFTPKISDGVLPGITRGLILEMARKINLSIIERTLFPEDLFRATEIFHTNSLFEIQSLSKINDHELKTGIFATITEKIKKHYSALKNALSPFN